MLICGYTLVNLSQFLSQPDDTTEAMTTANSTRQNAVLIVAC